MNYWMFGYWPQSWNASDVRYGTNMGGVSGTAHIPAAADVRLGVAVDDTVGTLVAATEADTTDAGNNWVTVTAANQMDALWGEYIDKLMGHVFRLELRTEATLSDGSSRANWRIDDFLMTVKAEKQS